ncbi:MAG: ferritin-like domain-containing protein [Actinomycetota bacterium]
MDTAIELFEHELRDIYDAEHKLVRALKTMADKATNEELKKGFEEHLEVTAKQAGRLERVFELIERKPRREPCDGINGLIAEYSGFAKEENPSPPVLDLFSTSAALKVEHYEICSYRSLIRLADVLGLSEAAGLFEQSLKEEQATAQELEQLSEKLGHEVSPR